MVRLLLDTGADINPQCGRYGNALPASAWAGGTEVARILLNTGELTAAPKKKRPMVKSNRFPEFDLPIGFRNGYLSVDEWLKHRNL